MKGLALILVYSFVFISCSATNEIDKAIVPPPEIKKLNLPSQSDVEIIFEVTSDFDGNLYYLHGKVLNFRLYSNSVAEFDDCLLEPNTGRKLIVEESCERKQIKIGEEEFKEFKQLLQDNTFKSLKSNYRKIESSCDAIPKVNIQAKNKIIKIAWCDNLTEPKISPDFPKELTRLFQLNREIRNSALGKEVISP